MVVFTEVMADIVKSVSVDKEVRLELSEDKLQITITPYRTEEPAKSIPQKRLDSGSYTFNGETKAAKEWAKEYGVARNTILYRFKHHGSPAAPSVTTADGSTKRSWPKPKSYEWGGRALTADEWAKEYNCTDKAIRLRFQRNGSPEPLIKTKTDKRKVK